MNYQVNKFYYFYIQVMKLNKMKHILYKIGLKNQ